MSVITIDYVTNLGGCSAIKCKNLTVAVVVLDCMTRPRDLFIKTAHVITTLDCWPHGRLRSSGSACCQVPVTT